MLHIASVLLLMSAFSPPTVTRRELVASAAATPLLLWGQSSNAATISRAALKAESRVEKMEELEERELMEEMRKIKRTEEMEEAQIRRIRAAQKNSLAVATNAESPEKLALQLEEEKKAVEADEKELEFVRAEYEEGMERLRAQKQLVANDRSELVRRRPTSAIDRLRLRLD